MDKIFNQLSDARDILKLDKQGYIHHYEDKYNERYPYDGEADWWAARTGEITAMIEMTLLEMTHKRLKDAMNH